MQLQLVEVLLDDPRGGGIPLDEDRPRCAARQRLEPQRARTGIEIEDDRVVDGADDVERVLARPVGRRTGGAPAGASIL